MLTILASDNLCISVLVSFFILTTVILQSLEKFVFVNIYTNILNRFAYFTFKLNIHLPND